MRSSQATIDGKRTTKLAGDDIIRLALLEIESRARQPGVLLNSYTIATDWFRLKLGEYEHEVFAAAWLDNRRRLIAFEELFRGTLDRTAVPARKVVKSALRHNAAAVLFAHNHPSGSVTASGEDMAITLELGRALDLVDVLVLDHFVVSAAEQPRSVWTGAHVALRPKRESSRGRSNKAQGGRPRANASSSRKDVKKHASESPGAARDDIGPLR